MSGARLRYILGAAVLGALLGALYGNHLYSQQGSSDLDVYQTSDTAEEPAFTPKEATDDK